MLEELHVRDLALIEEAWLEFGPGMTVLTGETGAGKTVLLGALKLLLGERADSASVRSGCAEALVEGRFAAGEGDTLVKRRVGADGRSRCALDNEMATVGALAERVGPLVDLHGQHEHQALLSVTSHVGYLDRWADAADALSAYRAARDSWRASTAERDALTKALDAAQSDAEALRFTAEEIGRVDPKAGEDDELEQRLPALRHSERLAEAASEASHALRGDGGALDLVAAASLALSRVAGIDPVLDPIAELLAEAEALIDDAGRAARAYRDGIEHDPALLEAAQARLAALGGLRRKYGPTLDDVIARKEAAEAALRAASGSGDALAEAEALVVERTRSLAAAGEALADVRHKAIPGFEAALAAAVADLAMEGCRFEVSMSSLEFGQWTADGPHRVEFMYSPAPGQEARPLAKIASGGEMSRVMLAIKSVLGSADSVGTLVFDEVDAGIGGATATAVGRRLAQLAQTHQVIVVTHLAQVAVFADSQLVVRKFVDAGVATTTVVPVEGEARVAEIARMLSGHDSEAGLTHAQELMDSAKSAVTAL